MTYTIGQRVNRIEDRDPVGAVIIAIQDNGATPLLELAYDEGGTGWWPADCVEPAERIRARNPDGTYRADDPTTPDVDEAWVSAT